MSGDQTKDEPPDVADGAQVLLAARLEGLDPTGVCRHYRNGELQAGFRRILIAQYAGEVSCYLFYCDGNWSVQNDTFHESITDACDFAESQFPGVGQRWIVIDPN